MYKGRAQLLLLIGRKRFIIFLVRNIFKIFTILVICAPFIFAQKFDVDIKSQDGFYKVDTIEIFGNDRTKEFVILRELTFSVGDSVNNEMLLFDRERIFSLGIFTKVDVQLIVENKKNKIVINIEESWHIFPVPFLRIREKTLKRTSYGISLKYKNFRGRNETIRAIVSLGYDPFYGLEYENPLLIPSADISSYFSVTYGTPINKSPTLDYVNGGLFDFKTFSIGTTWGKRFDKENNLYLILSYSNINAPSKILNPYMASGKSKDKIVSSGFAYVYDSRNLVQYANSGLFFGFNYLYNGLGNKEIAYNNLSVDVRHYREIYKSLIIKGRVDIRHTFGKYVPYYNYSLLGYDYYTRGNRYLVREGNNRILGSLELTYPLLQEWNFALDLPILPNSLTRSRIAIYASLFTDVATVFNNNNRHSLRFNDFNSGYGFGITFLFLPYSAFRIEFAFNEMGKGEFLLESGISF